MERVWTEYRSPTGVKNSLNFWNADLHFWSLGDILTKRWENPRWTPQNLESWDQLRRLVHRVQHWWAPGSLTEEQVRFIYNGNCVLVDRTVNLTMKVVDYCANDFVANLDRRTTPRWMSDLAERSPHGGDHLYHGWRRRAHFNYERMPLSEQQNDEFAWRRPRLNLTSAALHKVEASALRARYHEVDHRVYRRAVTIPRRGPAGTDLYDQLVMWFEDIFQFAFASQADSWFDDLRAWILNPNKDISQYPDVGLAYWVRFPFICHFPENVNCSIGMGMERALLWSAIVFGIVIVLSAAVLSLIDLPFRLLGYGIAFLIIFPAMAWHYSPMCGFPPPFVAVPMCIMDEIYAFLNKWITNCYVPLVLPAYMVAGDVCPTDPNQFINVISCAQVGVRDGLQNVLILGWWLFGSTFVDIVRMFSTIVFSTFFPGVNHYFQVTLDAFVNAGPTDQERQVFCFWATSPAMVTPIVIGVLAIVFVVAAITAGLALAQAIITLFMASPAAVAVTGPEESTWFTPPEEEFPEGEGPPEGGPDDGPPQGDPAYFRAPAATATPLGRVGAPVDGGWLTHWMFGGPPPARRRRPTTAAAWTKKNQ
jgi:hypothetical protein